MNLPPYHNQGIPAPNTFAAGLLSGKQPAQFGSSAAKSSSAKTPDETVLWTLDSLASEVPDYQWLSQNKSELGQPRWDYQAFPLSVYWTLCGTSFIDDEEHVNLLNRALSAWTDISAGVIQFQTPLAGATDEKPEHLQQILFEWADAATVGRDHEVGHADRQLTDGAITQATITLIRQPAIDGVLQSRTQQRQRLYTTLLHEIGHALGLNHSVNPQDVMYYRGWQHTALSPSDGRRISLLYSQ